MQCAGIVLLAFLILFGAKNIERIESMTDAIRVSNQGSVTPIVICGQEFDARNLPSPITCNGEKLYLVNGTQYGKVVWGPQ